MGNESNTMINLTPHEITLIGDERQLHSRGSSTYPPSGAVARVETVEVPGPYVDGFPSIRRSLGHVKGLPEPRNGVYYIVSSMVLEAAKKEGRFDVVCPDTGPNSVVRDAAGKIVGVRRWVF